MRLHRLRITDFKGIAEREVEFAASGVTVVNGANEAGKSSMIEALDLLLGEQAGSKKAKVRAVQPAGRDVGSEVTAELTCGDYRFEYFKRFNKKPETSLTVLAPVAEQLTGRAAHDRVKQILDSSLDNALFDALRLLQTADPELGGLADSSALSRALDRAVGTEGRPDAVVGAAVTEGAEEDAALIEAVEKEFRRYFTGTGRETAELAAARRAADEADAEVAVRRTARDAVAEAANALPLIEADRRALTDDLIHANEELAAATASRSEARELVAKVAHARTRADQKRTVVELAERHRTERADREARVAQSTRQIAEDEALLAETQATAETAAREAADLESSLVDSRAERDRRRRELDAAVAAEQAIATRERIDRIDRTLAEVADLTKRREALEAEASANPVTPAVVAEADRLSHAITAAQAKVDAAAAMIEVTALSDHAVEVDGEAVDGFVELPAVGERVVEVADVVRVVVRGAAGTQTLAAELTAAQEAAGQLVACCGVESLAEVAERAEARAAAQRAAADTETALRRRLDGSTPDRLRSIRDELASSLPDGEPEPAGSVAELRIAERELSDLISQAEAAAGARRSAADHARTKADLLTASIGRAREDLRREKDVLITQRAKYSDEALEAAVVTAQDDLDRARSELSQAEAEAARVDVDRLEAMCAEAEQNVERFRRRERELGERKAALRERLEVFRTENRLDELTAAEATAAAARDEFMRVAERAAGARVLHETLNRKRTENRSRYIAPFTDCLEELAAPVFGDSVRFDVADDFTIVSRTLDGTTVQVESLSGGAREQLGLLARLACARIVDEADGVPVILDDALGYSDPERLASMTAVLGRASSDAQIIVLTCDPERYAAVPDATLVAV